MTTQGSEEGLLRVVVIVLGVLVAFPLVMMVMAVPMVGMMGGGWNGGMAHDVSPLWALVMTLVWLLVLFGIGYGLYRALADGFGTGAASDPALEELRLAYARGDLSEEEFERRRSKLRAEE